jgi:dipeptidyl aminopeptidase/acylaminoacyl peptidase
MPERREFAPEDLLLEQRITDLHLIAGQPIAVCAVTAIDATADHYTCTLWTFSLDGRESRQLTQGPKVDDTPRWSPDGRQVAFLSDRDGGSAQLYVISLDGGEARRLTKTALDVQTHAWRPDGRQIAVVCGVAVDPEQRRQGTEDIDVARPSRATDEPEIVWRLPYKMDGTGYTLAQRAHLFLLDIYSGELEPLTRGDFDVMDVVWAPDGRRLAYTRTRGEPGHEHCSDLWVMDIGERGAVGESRRLSRQQSTVMSPSWSPDGRWVGFTGAVDDGDAQLRMWLADLHDGRVKPLGDESIEVVPGELQWQRDSRSVAFVRAHRGLQEVTLISVPGGQITRWPQHDRQVDHLAANERVAYTVESPAQGIELYSADWDGGNERQLSQFNRWWAQRRLPVVEKRRFEVPAAADEGDATEEIEGWLLLPEGRSGPVPLLVDVHGGPASYVPLEFTSHAYWQMLVSRGWAVLALNPVGSSSYGREFCDRLLAHWGERDLPQQLAAVKALQDEGIADQRLAIAGASYGGYLSAWAIGTCRHFRAAVVCAPVGNLEAHFGTSDSGYYADPYSMDGKPEANRELMARLSPMIHIEQACTPTLFLQGKDDQRCPIGQSEEMFVKLKRSAIDVPTEMVLYPGGSHHVFGKGRPSHRLDIARRIVAWLSRWIDQPLDGAHGHRAKEETAQAKEGQTVD